MSDILVVVFNLLSDFWGIFKVFIAETWWFWFFLILFPTTRGVWLYWRQLLYEKSEKYILLEIRMPREIDKGPRVMEQVLKSIHAMANAPANISDKYWEGETPRTFSFEIVSFGGEVRFYIRVYHKYKTLVSAAFFSYYKDVEMVEVDDYMKKLPADMIEVAKMDYDIWGTEMVLTKPSVYPVKTYVDFETPDEELQLDPISSFLEVLSKVKKREVVVIQIVTTSASANWYAKYQSIIDDLRKPRTKSLDLDSGFPSMRTPGETDILKAVEENISKSAFNAVIRFIYLSPKNIFYDSFARRGIIGSFNQYSTLNLNSFRQNFDMSTMTMIWYWPHLFTKTRAQLRKQRLFYLLRRRMMPPETSMGKFLSSHLLNWNKHSQTVELNTQVLATLFHPPAKTVLTAPHIKRVESRKAGPPAGLEIFGDEKALEKFE
ncbi:MAG: hypothetical protein Q8Q37_01245 [bacterium]|nr:hypothetical protein [bacterium]